MNSKPSAKVLRNRARAKAWRLANPERYRANQDRYREENQEKLHKYRKDRLAKDPDLYRKARKRALEAHPDLYKISHQRRHENPEYRKKAVETARKWREAHPEQYKRAMAEYRQQNREKIDARCAQWRLDNPERAKAITRTANNNRRARNLAVGEVSLADMREVLARCVCAACNSVHPRMEVDHIVALSRGGTNHISNLQLLCQPCNRSKWSFDHTEWLQRLLVTRQSS